MRKYILTLSLLLLLNNLIFAASYTWNGSTSSDLNTAANWTPAVIPTVADNITITSTGTFRPALTGDYVIAGFTISNLLGNTLDLGGFTLTITKTAAFSGGTISNGSVIVGSAILASTSTTFGGAGGGPVINATITVYSSLLTIQNSTFEKPVNFNKSGGGSGLSPGGNTFNDAVTMTNTGSSTLTMAEGSLGTLSDVYNGPVYFKNTGTSSIDVGNTSSGTIFNSKVTFDNSGGGSGSQINVAKSSGASLTFKDSAIFINAGTVAHGINIASSAGSTIAFNGHISVSNPSTAASSFIQFGPGANNLAEGKTVTIGAAGFATGILRFQNFRQGSISNGTALNITTGGTISITNESVFNGNLNFISSRLTVNSSTFKGTTKLEKKGISTDLWGNNNFDGITTITNSSGGDIFIGHTNPDTFSTDATFINTGIKGIKVAYSSSGNIFKGNVEFNNAGTSGPGSVNEISVAEIKGSDATFNGTVTFKNTGTLYTSIGIAEDGNCIFNGDILVNSTSSSSTTFGSDTGTVVLAEGKTIGVGPVGFSSGTLQLRNFSQGNVAGGTNWNLTLTGAAHLQLGEKAVVNANVNFVSPRLTLKGVLFNGVTTLEKSGDNIDYSTIGNIFNGTTTIINSGPSQLWLGEGLASPDTFNAALTLKNTGTGSMEIASRSPGNYFAKTVTVINLATGISSRISIARDYRGGSGTTAIFNDVVTLSNEGGSSSYIQAYANGSCTYNSNVIVSNKSGIGVLLGGDVSAGVVTFTSVGTSLLKVDKKISIGTGFSTGTLLIKRMIHGLTSTGAADHNLTLTGNATIILGPSTKFSGNVTVVAPRVNLNGCTFEGTATIEKNGAGEDFGSGGDVFNGVTTITNSGSGVLWIGSAPGSPEIFDADVTFNNTGSSGIDICDRPTGNLFTGNTIFNNQGTGISSFIKICEGWNPSFTKGTASFLGNVTFKNVGTGAFSFVRTNNNGTNSFAGNIYVSSSGGLGVLFGDNGGTANLAEGKTISLVSDGSFSAGTLKLKGFRQGTNVGLTTQTLKLTGTAFLSIGAGTVFNGNLDFSAPQVNLDGATYNGISTKIEKTGAGNNNSAGNNIFNSVMTITNTGSGEMVLATVNPDLFKKTVTFAGTGIISPAMSGQNNFEDDLICNANLSFNKGSGVCYFTGTTTQDISGTIAPTLPRMTVNKTSGKVVLGVDLTVSGTLSLASGQLDLNSKNLKISNTAITAIDRTNGYLLSEAADNSGKVSWTINAVTGKHVFPFGKSDGTYIPFTFDLTGGDAGIMTVATYSTGPDNKPYPTVPENVGYIDAAPENVVDRFWYTEKTGSSATATLTFTYAENEAPANGEVGLKAVRYQKLNNTWVIPTAIPVVDETANTVTVSGNTGFSTWTLSLTNPTAIMESSSESEGLVVYPNPANSGDLKITLVSEGSGEGLLSLYNVLGKEIYSENITLVSGKEIQLNFDGKIETGTYLLTLTTGQHVFRKKLVVK